MILKQWIASQRSPHTRSCYQRDADRMLAHVGKPLSRVTLGAHLDLMREAFTAATGIPSE
jgi:hypothetical protein